jgi:hypothetical protein
MKNGQRLACYGLNAPIERGYPLFQRNRFALLAKLRKLTRRVPDSAFTLSPTSPRAGQSE